MYILAPLFERPSFMYHNMLNRATYAHHQITKREVIEVAWHWAYLFSPIELLYIHRLAKGTASELMIYNGELEIQMLKIWLHLQQLQIKRRSTS